MTNVATGGTTSAAQSFQPASGPAAYRVTLDPNDEQLLFELSTSETFVRCLFDLPIAVSSSPQLTHCCDEQRRTRLVLCNYMYDAYVRLTIADREEYVIALPNVGTLLFVWSLQRAVAIDPLLAELTVDLERFSSRLNNLLRTASLDILLPEAIAFLERAAAHAAQSASPPSPQRQVVIGGGGGRVSANVDMDVGLLSRLKTYYDPGFENAVFDHSDHYDEAFVPLHRFSDRGIPSTNMSRYVGYTMRENIRTLYRHVYDRLISERSGNVALGGDRAVDAGGTTTSVTEPSPLDPVASSCCPCVVIFNFFIRDSYRMYYSKSLRQTSYVCLRLPSFAPTTHRDDSESNLVRLSYMIMTNLFPKANSWFKSISNQLVKKTGKIHIQHLDSFVRLLCLTTAATTAPQLPSSAQTPHSVSGLAVVEGGAQQRAPRPTRLHRRRCLVPLNSPVHPASPPVATCPSFVTSGAAVTAVTASTVQSQRPTLSGLYVAPKQRALLAAMFATRFRACRHRNVIRTYEQLRANDEGATLIRFCVDCGQRV